VKTPDVNYSSGNLALFHSSCVFSLTVNRSVQTDLNHFLKALVQALKPIAKAEDIDLTFSPATNPVIAIFLAPALASDVTHVICKLIEFTPEAEKIFVAINKTSDSQCTLQIRNTGINLVLNLEIVNGCKLPVRASSGSENSTLFEIEIDLFNEVHTDSNDVERINGPNFIPDYYAEIRKRLRSHFNKSDDLVETLLRSNPREAAFLKKINELIIANMQNDQFDANYLSAAMNLSRTQLFRRLKPIIRQSPGSYIRMLKLQKAKELFETTDLRISEVAYRTGFETASHFTKVFTKQYGVKPSLFCRKKPFATNGSTEKK
jgi:AraC-like DNA-binding protein